MLASIPVFVTWEKIKSIERRIHRENKIVLIRLKLEIFIAFREDNFTKKVICGKELKEVWG